MSSPLFSFYARTSKVQKSGCGMNELLRRGAALGDTGQVRINTVPENTFWEKVEQTRYNSILLGVFFGTGISWK
eukprot:1188277-Amphidinium_carterae.1